LFKLDKVLNLVRKLFGPSRKVLAELINEGLTFPEMIVGPRPKLSIKIQLAELLLIDDAD
jgi:hypothetical protein